MGAMAATHKRRILSLTGRTNRKEWARILGALIMGCFLVSMLAEYVGMPWSFMLFAPLIYVLVAASVRRAHDIGWTGWVIAIPFALTIALVAAHYLLIGMRLMEIPGPEATSTVALIMQLFSQAIPIVQIVILAIIAFSPGHDGPNVYGESS
jgi:uncharacterized membrane protein YhaH (DUF805 family)